MFELLKEAQQKNDRLPYILTEFYELYCKGYNFLQDLGIGFGLTVSAPEPADFWEELSAEQQKEMLESFSPKLEKCIEQVIYWLETKSVILTGEQDENGRFKYNDFRTAE
jgi:hypothetical protein